MEKYMNNTTVGVDLAKGVIQICALYQQKIILNAEMNVNDFALWLVKTKPIRIVFEACGTSNYWKQKAVESGHQVLLISAKLVNAIRQQQKNDKNDALSIVQASLLPNIKFIERKIVDSHSLN